GTDRLAVGPLRVAQVEGVDGAVLADLPLLRDAGFDAEVLAVVVGEPLVEGERDVVLGLAFLQAGVQGLALRAVVDDDRVRVFGFRGAAEEEQGSEEGGRESHGAILGRAPGGVNGPRHYAVGLSRLGIPMMLKPAST